MACSPPTRSRVATYAGKIAAPVVLETEVQRLAARAGGGFRLETNQEAIDARAVIVATGGYHAPRTPPCASALPRRVDGVHSHSYRNERELLPGAVLVVGSAQSGVQIVEELREAGRRVFLCVGGAGRVPRRYRGRDFFHWARQLAERGDALGTPLPTRQLQRRGFVEAVPGRERGEDRLRAGEALLEE